MTIWSNHQARACAPCIVFVDDVDAVAPVRGCDSSSERTMDRCPGGRAEEGGTGGGGRCVRVAARGPRVTRARALRGHETPGSLG